MYKCNKNDNKFCTQKEVVASDHLHYCYYRAILFLGEWRVGITQKAGAYAPALCVLYGLSIALEVA